MGSFRPIVLPSSIVIPKSNFGKFSIILTLSFMKISWGPSAVTSTVFPSWFTLNLTIVSTCSPPL